jgi:hypothetical protein
MMLFQMLNLTTHSNTQQKHESTQQQLQHALNHEKSSRDKGRGPKIVCIHVILAIQWTQKANITLNRPYYHGIARRSPPALYPRTTMTGARVLDGRRSCLNERDWLELLYYHGGEKCSNRVVIIPSLRPLDQALARLPFGACSYKIVSRRK